MRDGIACLAGIDAGLAGIQAAVDVGAAWKKPASPPLLPSFDQPKDVPVKVLDEAESKGLLARCGVPVPPGRVVRSAGEAAAAAQALGYPVVVKALGVAHKTDVGGVRLDLGNAQEVSAAVSQMSEMSESYLVEKMVQGVVAELIVGIARDRQFGPYLLVGGGGILVELLQDCASLLLPITRDRVLHALSQLRCAPLFGGFRGSPAADLHAAADAILAVAGMVEAAPSFIAELDINPLLLLAEGQGAVAGDALISLNPEAMHRQTE
jgi:acetyl-CoA synthetase